MLAVKARRRVNNVLIEHERMVCPIGRLLDENNKGVDYIVDTLYAVEVRIVNYTSSDCEYCIEEGCMLDNPYNVVVIAGFDEVESIHVIKEDWW